MCSFDIEICSNCGREMPRSEQAHVFEGKIVCAECDNALRSNQIAEPNEIPEPPTAPGPTTTAELQLEESNQSRPQEQEKEKQYRGENKHPGFMISGVILCLLGIGLIGMGLIGLAVMFLLGVPIFGVLMAVLYLTTGTLIIISGIAATIIAAISR
jgi:hypothetical protein